MTPQHETTPEGRGPPAGPSTIEKQQQAGIASSEEGGSISSGSADASPVRPASIKRVRTSEADLSGLEISIPPPASTAAPATATATATGVGAGGLLGSPPLLPPPPDCPPYLQASQLPVWVGRAPVGAEQQQQLTPERVDELHHVQWRAWKGEGQSGGDRDYGRILEVAPSLFHAAFARMNPHNCAITVGITVDAMHATGAPPLVCATTFLYGLSLLADNPVRVVSLFFVGLGGVCRCEKRGAVYKHTTDPCPPIHTYSHNHDRRSRSRPSRCSSAGARRGSWRSGPRTPSRGRRRGAPSSPCWNSAGSSPARASPTRWASGACVLVIVGVMMGWMDSAMVWKKGPDRAIPNVNAYLNTHAKTRRHGNRVEAHVERLMGLGKEKEALGLIKRCLEAPWADQQKVWCVDG